MKPTLRIKVMKTNGLTVLSVTEGIMEIIPGTEVSQDAGATGGIRGMGCQAGSV